MDATEHFRFLSMYVASNPAARLYTTYTRTVQHIAQKMSLNSSSNNVENEWPQETTHKKRVTNRI